MLKNEDRKEILLFMKDFGRRKDSEWVEKILGGKMKILEDKNI